VAEQPIPLRNMGLLFVNIMEKGISEKKLPLGRTAYFMHDSLPADDVTAVRCNNKKRN
jgi:hypothetical protein